jgi:hypothetical protein
MIKMLLICINHKSYIQNRKSIKVCTLPFQHMFQTEEEPDL